MTKLRFGAVCLIMVWFAVCLTVRAEVMTFDSETWDTGDMNQQYPANSNGNATNSHIDYYYYSERVPMRMTALKDSLNDGSPARSYDSAIFTLVVAGQGLSGSDSMRVFGRRLTRNWSAGGASWNCYWADEDSAWNTPGGDVNDLACTDTLIIDAAVIVYDTLSFRLDTGFVRHMVEDDNFGWLMAAENLVDRGTFMVFTELAATEAYRPTLTVYYSEGEPAESYSARRRRGMHSLGRQYR